MRVSTMAVALLLMVNVARGDDPAVERGRDALTRHGYLKASWSDKAYKKVGASGGSRADPDRDPAGYLQAFCERYGLHKAPYPNDGLPMGLRRGESSSGVKPGITIDCLICHGGSIGGQSYVGLGNTRLGAPDTALSGDGEG